MDQQMLQHRFAALTTAHVADACIRARVPVRCASALLRAVVPGSRLAGRVCPAKHAGSVDAVIPILVALQQKIRKRAVEDAERPLWIGAIQVLQAG